MPRPRLHALAPLLAAALLAGCEPLAENDYPGEPLLTVHGRVTGTAPLPPLEAAILWQRGPPPTTNEQELATRAPVDTRPPTGPTGPTGDPGSASASFTLTLYQPPPASALRTLRPGEPAWARASAGAVPYGLADNQAASLPTSGSNAYGVDPGHWILWLAADVPPGSLTAWWLGAAFPAGYHLLRVKPYDACAFPAEVDACVETLVALGVPDDGTDGPGTARSACLARYRLEPAAAGEALVLQLGVTGLADPGGPCP